MQWRCGIAALACVALCACGDSGPQPTGSAYAGPATLILRSDLGVRTAASATVHHGERLDILETRRRFVKVRTKDGMAGWTDSSNLLTQAQMDDLTELSSRALKLPSQGVATVYDTLNVHTSASRTAPSFAQLAEGDEITVIGHRITPRSVTTRKPAKAAKSKSVEDDLDEDPIDEEDLPPPPAPPGVPQDWQQLSRPRIQDLPGGKASRGGGDDWFLVRTAEGKAGWVLTRMVLMSVPDEVAQNAAGHYIMGYQVLGATQDPLAGEAKSNYLWTTSSRGMLPYDFDGIRVFIFNLKRQRYETAYVERNLKGYYPVEVTKPQDGQPNFLFSLVTEESDGSFLKRSYSFSPETSRVKLVSKVPDHAPPPLPDVRVADTFDPATKDIQDDTWSTRFRNVRKRYMGR